MTRRLSLLLLAATALLFAATGCMRTETDHDVDAVEPRVGPHGGRWFADGDFALELAIFEQGVPPEFRAYAFRGDAPVDPSEIALEVTLHRLGGRIDRIEFAPRGDHLLGDPIVREPHSFEAELLVRENGREHRFDYSTYENRVTLEPEQLALASISVATAGPATIREHVKLNGRIVANEDALAHVVPRFPGVVRSIHARLGDTVERGELLVTIESNESLQTFDLRAPLSGSVIAKDVAPGDFVSTSRTVYEIADLRTVWVDLDVYRRDFARLRVGQAVAIDAGDGSKPVQSTVAYLSPIGATNTQTMLARVVLPNPDGSWHPGLFVTGEVEVDAVDAPVVVAAEALQRVRSWDVVFLADGNTFEAQPVELGRRDRDHVEILSGLSEGQTYVTAGSFVLKADAGKSGASHDH